MSAARLPESEDRNIIENGFFSEFQLAMANLLANNASGIAGRAGSLAYFGPGNGTTPLPIYLAYFTGSTDRNNININGSYQYAIEGGSAHQGRRYGRVMNPTANVRHASKMQWDYSVPVGRGRRFGGDMNRILDGVLGGWEFNGAGRIQARTINFGNVRLVGVSIDELTDAYTFEVPNPTTGSPTVYLFPQDIIDNTRRAFSLSATSANGYSSMGAPAGRYFAPANGPDCIQLRAGDCAPRTLLVRQPLFTRVDMGLTKRFRSRTR